MFWRRDGIRISIVVGKESRVATCRNAPAARLFAKYLEETPLMAEETAWAFVERIAGFVDAASHQAARRHLGRYLG